MSTKMSTAKCRLVLELLSYWHIGSGRGAAASADAVVAKDRAGLPYVPGKTLKGLARDAMTLAEEVGVLPAGRANHWLGTALAESVPTGDLDDKEQADAMEGALEEARFRTRQGQLWFGSACLPEPWLRWAANARGDGVRPVIDELFTHVASTAIDARGIAREHTLRVREVAVPMTLRAEVLGPSPGADGDWVADLEAAVPLLRSLGSRRHRGLGRVAVTLERDR